MIRIGSSDEKELLFRAFIEKDEFFEYKKEPQRINQQKQFRKAFMIELLDFVKMQNHDKIK